MRPNRVCGAMLVFLLSGSLSISAQTSKKKSSKFETLIDQLINQVDQQMLDRDKQSTVLSTFYKKLQEVEQKVVDDRTPLARQVAISRESMLTADEMIRDPKNKARVTEFAAFLRRSVVRDQELFDKALRQSESIRFQHERQLAKIRSEQTILKSIRRDLERLKAFPTNSERTSFFLNTVKSFLDGLSAVSGSE